MSSTVISNAFVFFHLKNAVTCFGGAYTKLELRSSPGSGHIKLNFRGIKKRTRKKNKAIAFSWFSAGYGEQ